MTYDYNSKIYLAEAVLNVKDLARQTVFYTQVIGLEILSQTATEIVLGAGNKPLVHLIETNRVEAVKSSYGLYHMAIFWLMFSNILLSWTILLLVPLTMVIAKPFIWRTLRVMALSSIETSLLLNGIFVRMVASLG